MNTEEMSQLYDRVMNHEALGWEEGEFMVRLWDGMDGCWTDCTTALPAHEALAFWCEKTGNGKHNTDGIRDIDYYRIFEADTRMLWDG